MEEREDYLGLKGVPLLEGEEGKKVEVGHGQQSFMRRIQQRHWGQWKGGHAFSDFVSSSRPTCTFGGIPASPIPIRHFPPNHLLLSLMLSGFELRGRKRCRHYCWQMLGTSAGELWFFLSLTEGNWRIFHCAGQTRNQELRTAELTTGLA